MHRWFFANERETCIEKSDGKEDEQILIDEKEATHAEAEIPFTCWRFCVQFDDKLHGNEYLAITGNCHTLGNFEPQNARILVNEANSNKYKAEIEIPRNQDIYYRYIIIAVNTYKHDVAVRFWETHKTPRIIRSCQNMLKDCDRFGYQNNVYHVERACTFKETYVHFKVFNAPFHLPRKLRQRTLYVKITPVYPVEPEDCLDHSARTTESNDILNENSCSTEITFAEVATLTDAECNKFKEQHEFGARCGNEDIVLFHLTIANMEITNYHIDVYTYAYKAAADEPPYYFAYGCIKSNELNNSEGSLQIKLTCASTHRPIGSMNIDYLLIRPMPMYGLNLHKTYTRDWDINRLPLDIGHRGCGETFFQLGDLVRENTIYSANRAAGYNFDFVEFDVMLNADGVPILNHDATIRLVHDTAEPIEQLLQEHDIILLPMEHFNLKNLRNTNGAISLRHETRLPVHAFTQAALQNCKPLRYASSEYADMTCERMMQMQRPFSLLQDVFTAVVPTVGFIVDVKWVQKDINNRWQDNGIKTIFDRNYYVDQILELTLNSIGNRPLIFSSYDCDICAMLRYKQNRYPVVLKKRNTHNTIKFRDARVNDFRTHILTAEAFELYGAMAHASDLLIEPQNVQYILKHNLIPFALGTICNYLEIRKQLKMMGVKGILYGRPEQDKQGGGALAKSQFFVMETAQNAAIFEKLFINELRAKCNYTIQSNIESERRYTLYSNTMHKWTFSVYTNSDNMMNDNSYFGISGNCDALGNWSSTKFVSLNKSKLHANLWTIELDVPHKTFIEYRYLIYTRDPIKNIIHLRFWETHTKPRTIRPHDKPSKEPEHFGWIQNNYKVDRAWLLNGSYILQFKIFNAPFYWNNGTTNIILTAKLTRLTTQQQQQQMSNDLANMDCKEFTYCEVSTLSNPQTFFLSKQPNEGTRCGTEDLVIFHAIVSNLELTVFRFDFYTYQMNGTTEPLQHYGYANILPEQIQGSEGQLNVLILGNKTNRLLCTMQLNYLLIKPMENANELFTFEKSYLRECIKGQAVLHIGERGCGKTYTYFNDRIRENTIYSYKRAIEHSADMIKIDVMLTKDAEPIANFDHVLTLLHEPQMSITELLDNNDVYVFPMQHFTLQNLMKLSKVNNKEKLLMPIDAFTHDELSLCRAYRFATNLNADYECVDKINEQMPFPLLKQILKEVTPAKGFLIDIKSTKAIVDENVEYGTFESKFDRNYYIDRCLDTVFRYAGTNRIIFSSSDPDICAMIRFKQNLYPVMLRAKNSKSINTYQDERLTTVRALVGAANAMEYLGNILHVEAALDNPQNIGYVNEHNLVTFIYGSRLSDKDVRNKLKAFGANGFIYERIDQKDQAGIPILNIYYLMETEDNAKLLNYLYQNEINTKCNDVYRSIEELEE